MFCFRPCVSWYQKDVSALRLICSSIKPPKYKNKATVEDKLADVTSDWAELPHILFAMQENIKWMIHTSIQELGESLAHQWGQRNPLFDRAERVEDTNPFARDDRAQDMGNKFAV